MPAPTTTGSCTCQGASVTPAPRDLSALTPREGTVLLLLATGLGNAPIARRLGITERTVKKHVTTVLDKLRVTSRLQAALIANHQHHELCRVPDAHTHPPADRTGRPPPPRG